MGRIVVVDPQSELEPAWCIALERDGHDLVRRGEPAGMDVPPGDDVDLVLATLAAFRGYGESRPLPAPPVMVLARETMRAGALPALRLGYDAYLRHPFRAAAFHSRIEEMLHGSTGAAMAPPRSRWARVRLSDVVVDPREGTVQRAGTVLQLSHRELEVFRALLCRDGALARRGALLHEIWGRAGGEASRVVDNCVRSLRQKLEPQPGMPRHILTVHNAGYRLVGAAPVQS